VVVAVNESETTLVVVDELLVL